MLYKYKRSNKINYITVYISDILYYLTEIYLISYYL